MRLDKQLERDAQFNLNASRFKVPRVSLSASLWMIFPKTETGFGEKVLEISKVATHKEREPGAEPGFFM
jgi:hypothetical protein